MYQFNWGSNSKIPDMLWGNTSQPANDHVSGRSRSSSASHGLPKSRRLSSGAKKVQPSSSSYLSVLCSTGSQFGSSHANDAQLKDQHQANNQSEYRLANERVCDVIGCDRYHNKPFSSGCDLNRHKRDRHGARKDGDEFWRCPVDGCSLTDRLWTRSDNLKQHIVRVHGEEHLNEALKSTAIYRKGELVLRQPQVTSSDSQSLNVTLAEQMNLPMRDKQRSFSDIVISSNDSFQDLISSAGEHWQMHNAQTTPLTVPLVSSSYTYPITSADMRFRRPDFSYTQAIDDYKIPSSVDFIRSQAWSDKSPTNACRLSGSDGAIDFSACNPSQTLATSFPSFEDGTQADAGSVVSSQYPSTPILQIDTNTPNHGRKRRQCSSASQDNGYLSPTYQPRSRRNTSCSSQVMLSDYEGESVGQSPDIVPDSPVSQLTTQEHAATLQLAWQILILCDKRAKQCPISGDRQDTSSNSGSVLPSSQTSTQNGSSSARGKKRSRQSGGDDGDDDSRRRRQPVPTESSWDLQVPATHPWFACPYYKHDYRRYSESNTTEGEMAYRKCVQVSIRNIPQLKRHLCAAHKRPDFYCRSCLGEFTSLHLLNQHLWTETCVPCGDGVDRWDKENKMTHDTCNEVRSCKKPDPSVSDWAHWYVIFKILFPRDPKPASPCIDAEHARAVQKLSELFRVIGPIAHSVVRSFYEATNRSEVMYELTDEMIQQAWEIARPHIGQPLPEAADLARLAERPDMAPDLSAQQQFTDGYHDLIFQSHSSLDPMDHTAMQTEISIGGYFGTPMELTSATQWMQDLPYLESSIPGPINGQNSIQQQRAVTPMESTPGTIDPSLVQSRRRPGPQ